jgi:hypothetical protein
MFVCDTQLTRTCRHRIDSLEKTRVAATVCFGVSESPGLEQWFFLSSIHTDLLRAFAYRISTQQGVPFRFSSRAHLL